MKSVPESQTENHPDVEFKKLEFRFIQRFKKKPSLEAILLLIGFQESPQVKNSQNKEEKLDLINLGVLTVLSRLGYFRRRDTESGWPEFDPLEKEVPADRERLIRQGIVAYFKEHDLQSTDL